MNANLEKPIYVEYPPGAVELGYLTKEERDRSVIELQRAMFGTVDAPLRFMLTMTKHLTQTMGMLQSKTDPCVFYK